jgi:hypothetical protein
MLEARAKKEDNRQAHSSSKKRKNLASSDLENDKKKAKCGKPKVINERKKGLLAIQE